MAWIAVEKKSRKTGKQWCDRWDAWVAARVTERECFCWPEECEIVCCSGFVNVTIVFLICLMFIFERRPIQITLCQIHLVSVIKCVNTCQVCFWINYWRAWMDKQWQHSWYLPDFTQQYFSCISVTEVMLISYLCEIFAECAVSSDFKPCVWIDINQAAMQFIIVKVADPVSCTLWKF